MELIFLKFEHCGFTIKDADETAFSVDPDKSSLTCIYTDCPDMSVCLSE